VSDRIQKGWLTGCPGFPVHRQCTVEGQKSRCEYPTERPKKLPGRLLGDLFLDFLLHSPISVRRPFQFGIFGHICFCDLHWRQANEQSAHCCADYVHQAGLFPKNLSWSYLLSLSYSLLAFSQESFIAW